MRIPLPKGRFAKVHTLRIALVIGAACGVAWLAGAFSPAEAHQTEPVQITIPFVIETDSNGNLQSEPGFLGTLVPED